MINEEIKNICNGVVKQVLKKSKETGLIKSSDLDNIEQVTRILKNISQIPEENRTEMPLDISTEELLAIVGSSSKKNRA